jgi:pimeloyl-ACP methyl ester carboxylesterase
VWEQSLEGTESITIDFDGKSLGGFRYGEGPLVFLVHGWGGRAAQMGQLARSIADQGFTVVGIDFPGHGERRWDTSDVFQMSAALTHLAGRFGQPQAVVAHSLGAMASVYAFQGAMPERVVLLAPMLDINEALDTFAGRARLMPWTAALLKRRLRRFCGDSWAVFAAGSGTDFGDADVLVVHDPEDPDTRFESSAVLAAVRDRTSLLVANSKGHNGVLADGEVAGAVARFLSGAALSQKVSGEGLRPE